jgi:predicted branched-subunit amino acid permease
VPTMQRPGRSELLTVAFSFFALGVSVSVALVDRGVPDSIILGAALVVHSATSELAFVAVSDANGTVAAGVLSGWLVSARFGVLAATLAGRLNVGLPERILAGLNSFDPNVTLAIQQQGESAVRSAFWRTTGCMLFGWWIGSAVGVFLGNILGDTDRLGLDMVFPAALLSIIGNLLRQREGLVAAIVGVAVLVILFPFAPAGLPLLLSVVGVAAGWAYVRRHAKAVVS